MEIALIRSCHKELKKIAARRGLLIDGKTGRAAKNAIKRLFRSNAMGKQYRILEGKHGEPTKKLLEGLHRGKRVALEKDTFMEGTSMLPPGNLRRMMGEIK